MPWVRFFAAKYLSSPTRLMMNTSQRAIYLDLLFYIHEHGGRIPKDPKKLAVLAAVSLTEFEAAWPVVGKHFISCDDDPEMITNAVMLQAIQESEEKARIGRTGGLAKASRLAGARSIRQTEQNRTDSEKKRTESARADSSSFLTLGDSQAEFLQTYPKRTRQAAAISAYATEITSAELHAELMAGLERWQQSQQWQDSLEQDGGRYIPDPDRFITERRWKDHPPQKLAHDWTEGLFDE